MSAVRMSEGIMVPSRVVQPVSQESDGSSPSPIKRRNITEAVNDITKKANDITKEVQDNHFETILGIEKNGYHVGVVRGYANDTLWLSRVDTSTQTRPCGDSRHHYLGSGYQSHYASAGCGRMVSDRHGNEAPLRMHWEKDYRLNEEDQSYEVRKYLGIIKLLTRLGNYMSIVWQAKEVSILEDHFVVHVNNI